MATNKLQWKRIAKEDRLPCQSFLRKKDGEILKLSTSGGVKVGQDCYYLPVDEVINVIKDYPVEESKDERIRKAIYDCVKWFGFDSSFFEDVSQEECLDWLEKQGQTFTKKDIDDAYLKGVCDAKHELEKHGEQKPVDKIQLGKKYKCIASPRYTTFVKGSIHKPDDKFLCSLMNFCSDCFVPIEDGEQKPILDVEIPFGAKDSELEEVSYDIPKGYHAEIEDNKVVIKKGEQKSAEWSEEDENLLKLSLENLTELKDRFGEEYGKVGDCIVLLESLKGRYAFKPSKEQLNGLKEAIEFLGCTKTRREQLQSLYEQLKKL